MFVFVQYLIIIIISRCSVQADAGDAMDIAAPEAAESKVLGVHTPEKKEEEAEEKEDEARVQLHDVRIYTAITH